MKRRSVVLAVAAAAVSSLALAPAPSGEPRQLTRSLYLPIDLTTCEHLFDGVLYEDGRPVAQVPAERIYQFTYYPELERMAPEAYRLRIEGTYEDGETFVAKLAVAPDGVHSARRHAAQVSSDFVEKKLRYRRDVRVPEKAVRLRCPRFCPRAEDREPRSTADPSPVAERTPASR